MTERQTAHLDNWRIVEDQLRGDVYGHPNFAPGEPIVTSSLLNIDFEHKVAQTRNTDYTLGRKFGE